MENFSLMQDTEEWFIHSFGVTTGYTVAPLKILRCFFVSTQAKLLYLNLKSYVYKGKGGCYPSQVSLRLELGLSKDTLTKYIRELEDFGFIERKHRPSLNTYYIFKELKTVPVIYHSEIIHEAKSLYENINAFYKAFNEYKETELCTKLNNTKDYMEVVNLRDSVLQWFSANIVDIKIIPRDNIQTQSSLEGTSKRSNRKIPYSKLPVEEWGSWHFYKYFEDAYRDKYKRPYSFTNEPLQKDLKLISRLLEFREKEGEKEKIKTMMDIYMSNPFFDARPRTLGGFCHNYVQHLIEHYIQTNSFDMGSKSGINEFGNEHDFFNQLDDVLGDGNDV